MPAEKSNELNAAFEHILGDPRFRVALVKRLGSIKSRSQPGC